MEKDNISSLSDKETVEYLEELHEFNEEMIDNMDLVFNLKI